jgi:hypothetical protein
MEDRRHPASDRVGLRQFVADRDVIGQALRQSVHEGERIARTVSELVPNDDGALLVAIELGAAQDRTARGEHLLLFFLDVVFDVFLEHFELGTPAFVRPRQVVQLLQ